jgi:hypothetical protein
MTIIRQVAQTLRRKVCSFFKNCLFNDAINIETIVYNIDIKVKLNMEQLVE